MGRGNPRSDERGYDGACGYGCPRSNERSYDEERGYDTSAATTMSVQDVITLIRQLERRIEGFPRSNWTANAEPTANDDADKGYQVGSWWYRPDLNKLWICKGATMGAAVWQLQAAGGGAELPEDGPGYLYKNENGGFGWDDFLKWDPQSTPAYGFVSLFTTATGVPSFPNPFATGGGQMSFNAATKDAVSHVYFRNYDSAMQPITNLLAKVRVGDRFRCVATAGQGGSSDITRSWVVFEVNSIGTIPFGIGGTVYDYGVSLIQRDTVDAVWANMTWVAVAFVPGGGYQSLLSGLVSYWPLDDTRDTQHDVIGTNHLSDAQFNCLRPGKMGFAQAFEFEAPAVGVSSPGGMNTRDWTIAGWFMPTAGGSPTINAQAAEGQDGTLEVSVGNASGLSVRVYDAANVAYEVFTPPGSVQEGRWQFVAITKQGSSLGIQINGNAPVTGIVPACGAAFTSFNLGADSSATADRPGIDELGFWRRALSASEIATLYNKGSGVAYPFSGPCMPGGYAGARLVSDGTELAAVRASEGRIVFDDFESGSLTGPIGAQGWVTAVGSGGTVVQIAGEPDAVGVIRLNAIGASANAALYSGSASCNSRLFGRLRMIFRARVRLNQVTGHSFRIGFQNGAGTNGVFFQWDTVSGHWLAKAAEGGAVTSIDTAWPAGAEAGVWTTLEIDVAADASEARFWVDGHPQARVTTNIPTTVGREFGVSAQLTSSGETGGSVDIDWIELVTFAPVLCYGAAI